MGRGVRAKVPSAFGGRQKDVVKLAVVTGVWLCEFTETHPVALRSEERQKGLGDSPVGAPGLCPGRLVPTTQPTAERVSAPS